MRSWRLPTRLLPTNFCWLVIGARPINNYVPLSGVPSAGLSATAGNANIMIAG